MNFCEAALVFVIGWFCGAGFVVYAFFGGMGF